MLAQFLPDGGKSNREGDDVLVLGAFPHLAETRIVAVLLAALRVTGIGNISQARRFGGVLRIEYLTKVFESGSTKKATLRRAPVIIDRPWLGSAHHSIVEGNCARGYHAHSCRR
jgi:hypothetical protein